MRNVTLPLNPIQISSLLSQCGKDKLYPLGSSIHASILKTSHHFTHQTLTILHNSLISLYSKCGHLPESKRVFDQMQPKGTISWNSIISAHLMNDELCKGFKYFKTMCRSSYEFDHATLTTVLSVCSKPGFLYACEMMHCLIIASGFVQMVPVGNALVTGYFKCGGPNSAQKVFDEMLGRSVITWTAMVSGMAQSQLFDKSLVLFREMRKEEEEEANSLTYSSSLLACSGLRALREGKQIHGLVVKSGFQSDFCVESALMDVYSKCGEIEDACLIFRSCREPDDISLTVMLVGLAQNGFEEKALELFVDLVKKGIKIDASMVSAVLGAFGTSAPFSLGKQIHSLILKTGLGQNVFVCNGLINMYSKCGEISNYIEIFESMVDKNAVSWNSMIAACARHGHGSKALQLFENMKLEGIKPTDVTFISLLHACSHVGEVEKGMEFLASMFSIHGITPRLEHYSCVVDMLGRAGLLKTAKSFIQRLLLKSKVLLWQALLGACCVHGDLDTGKFAAEQLILEAPDCVSAYVLLANICSLEGKWEERARIATKMKEMGVKKEKGLSWIEIEKEIHSFGVEDKDHSECEVIYEVLDELIALIRKEECVFDENNVLDGLQL